MTSTLFEAVLDASIYGKSNFQEEAQLASVFRNLLGERLGDKRILELRHGLGPILTTIAEGNTEQFLIQQFNMAIDRGEALFEYNPDRFDGFDTETMQDVRTSIEGTMYDPFTRDEDGKIIAIKNIGMLNEAMIRGDVRPVFEAFNQIGTEERYYDRRQLARIKREEAERAEQLAAEEGAVDIQESPSRHLNIRVGVLGAVQQIADVWELTKTIAKYAGEMETLGEKALEAAQKFYGDVKGLAFRSPMGLLPRTVITSMRGFSVAATTDPDGDNSAFNERWTTACKHIHTEPSAQAAIASENYRLIGHALGDEVHWVRGVTSSGRRGWVPVPLEKTPGKVAL
jgi:hypothetical protein